MQDPKLNRLALETSPYLLQHATDPVDWYPWGEEALATARATDKPLFLSVGYSACHWCHVMEHESFEDPATARLMNELFVNVKVDREERPDLDELYMQAVQMFTGGHGGWPMSVFLTPALEPYLGGTYFPPEDRHGLPGFPTLLRFAAEAYRQRPGDVSRTTRHVLEALRRVAAVEPASELPAVETLHAAFRALRASYDAQDGGFGGAPKFPQPMGIAFLLRYFARTRQADALSMAMHTLECMARGGLYDQLGGGFHRYSTDAHWLVPHFEKMLYDNALLARVYLEAHQLTGDPFCHDVALEVLEYLAREMTGPEGAFSAAQDADSEGVEGEFFVWTPQQIAAALGERDARVLCRYYGVGSPGNFERGASVLAAPRDPDALGRELGSEPEEMRGLVLQARRRLFAARAARVPPGRDDKVIVAWNALAISAFACAAQALREPAHLRRAAAAADFVLARIGPEGLFRTARGDRVQGHGFLDDHAAFVASLLDLYEASFEPRWFEAAERLNARLLEEFWDREQGGFFYTGSRHETLLARSRHPFDNATPAGNSLQAGNLLRLAALTGDGELRAKAERTLQVFSTSMQEFPGGMAEMLCALDRALGPTLQIAIAGRGPAAELLRRAVFEPFVPRKVVAGWPEEGAPARLALLRGRGPVGSLPAAYVCRDFTCELPVTDPAELGRTLSGAAGGPELR